MSRAEYQREYYAKNRERVQEINRRSYYKNRDRILAHQKEYYQDNIEKYKGHNKTRGAKRYGMSVEEYDIEINKPCEICEKGPEGLRMVIDHTTDGSYHGTLCLTCNAGIGMLQDDLSIIHKAVEYVKRTRG